MQIDGDKLAVDGGELQHGVAAQPSRHRRGWTWWYLLFLVQFVAVLWPPFFNRLDPRWFGIPFFYWYQLLWVIIGAACTATVYFATRD